MTTNAFGLGEVPPLETLILALTILRHFAKPVLWDSFKNLLGWAFKKEIKMDLAKHKFPEVNELDMAFSTFKTDKALLAEAKERGFYGGHTPYNKLFSKLFFSGGKVKFKQGVDEEFRSKAWKYCCSFMGSFEPKHQEKEAICALLMSELLEPELETA